jgi:hypothetical protein
MKTRDSGKQVSVRKKHILVDNKYHVYLVLGGHKNDEFTSLRDAQYVKIYCLDASLASELKTFLAPNFDLYL